MKVVISGAGIAGLTLAYWLERYGFKVKIVEKARDLQQRQGYMIDFWGPGYDVAEKMQILDTLMQRNNEIPKLIYVNREGKESSILNLDKFRNVLDNRIVTLLRGDLENVLLSYLPSHISIETGVEIIQVVNQSDNVKITYSNGLEEEADILVGADGIHSKIRQLVFGDESNFSNYLGYRVGAFIQPGNVQLDNAVYAYSIPEKQMMVFPLQGNKLATYFIYKSAKALSGSPKQRLQQQFENQGWVTPEILHNMRHAKEVFLDTLTQIEMPQWHQGRVVLVGDACQCLTLMAGQGASMAMAGAYSLAYMMNKHRDSYQQAFSEYQSLIKPNIELKQKEARKFVRSMVPNTDFGIFCRNFVTRFIAIPVVAKGLFKGLMQENLVLPG